MLLLSVYDRNKAGEGFLGMLQIKPVLKDGYTLDQWYKLGVRGNEAVSGEVWIQITFTAIRVSGYCGIFADPKANRYRRTRST